MTDLEIINHILVHLVAIIESEPTSEALEASKVVLDYVQMRTKLVERQKMVEFSTKIG